MRKVIKGISIISLSLFVLVLVGCSSEKDQNGKISIVTSFYPLYEIAKQVGGDQVAVKNLVPPGAEPHDYDLSPRDVVSLNQAQLVIYNGLGLEPWADKMIPDLVQAGIPVLNESVGFIVLSQDPHIWLDPVQYTQEVSGVAQKLEQIDYLHQDIYKKNAENFIKQLDDLNKLYEAGLKNCKFRTFVTNHAAFAYLAKRYNLEMVSIAGVSPDAEPSAKTLADLTNLVKGRGIKYILVETLVSPKIAETLANEVGAQTLVMNPLEGLTDQEIANGRNYVSVMKENLKNLQTALQCE